MAQTDGWTPVAEPAGWTPVASSMEKPADFKVTAEADPNNLSTFVSHVGQQINPLALVSSVANAIVHPIDTVKSIGAAQGALYDKAKASYEKGDYVTAARHFVDYLIPLVGPGLDKSADEFQAGKWAAGGGDAIGLGLALFGPKALSNVAAARYPLANRPGIQSPMTQPNPTVQFAQDRNIPLDAATVSDNLAVKGTQALADRSIGGSMVATPANEARAAAMSRVAGELADEAHPVATTPEQAATGVKGSIQSLMKGLNAQATDAYDRLRAIEADPKHSDLVASAPEGSATHRSILGKLAAGSESGMAPTNRELLAMRQIEAELDAQSFSRGKLVDFGNEYGSDARFVKGSSNADVYHEIQQAAGSHLTGSEMLSGIKKTLETGDWNQASRGALKVAQDRLRTGSTSGPLLPSNTPLVGTLDRVALPVDLTLAKKALAPLYDRLKRESELIPLQGDKGRALVALDRLLNGPDRASVSVVDAALGDLKSFARADIPELRTQGQGAAAFAVQQLDRAVKQAAMRAGPQAINALEEGRSATVAKYLTGDVFEQLRDEPVQAFRQMTAPKDAGIKLLRQVADAAPAQMPELARGYLEDLLDKPNKVAEWRKLGTQTKAILFPRAGQAEALDQFFNLTDRISKTNVNPSGSRYIAALGAQGALLWTNPATGIPIQIAGAALSKLLRSPQAINALTRGMTVPNTAPLAIKAAATANLLRAATAAGVPLDLPKAADQGPSR